MKMVFCPYVKVTTALRSRKPECSNTQGILLVTAFSAVNYSVFFAPSLRKSSMKAIPLIRYQGSIGFTHFSFGEPPYGTFAVYDYESETFSYIPNQKQFDISSSLHILSRSFSFDVWPFVGFTLFVLILFVFASKNSSNLSEILFRVIELALQPGTISDIFRYQSLRIILLLATFLLSFLYSIDMTAKMTAPPKAVVFPCLSDALNKGFKLKPIVSLDLPKENKVIRVMCAKMWSRQLRQEGFNGDLTELSYWDIWFYTKPYMADDYKNRNTIYHSGSFAEERGLLILPKGVHKIPKQYGNCMFFIYLEGINSGRVESSIKRLLYVSGIKGYISLLRVHYKKLKWRWDIVQRDVTVVPMSVDFRIL